MVFSSLIKTPKKPTVYLGAPEAEAEANPSSRVRLEDVYDDYHHLLPELMGEKFMVIGRKGSGKSAFAEYVAAMAKKDPNLFCQFIRKSEFNLEKEIQIGTEAGASVESEGLFRWVIYTNILKLFSENTAIASNKDYELLRQFLKKNSGYINIDAFAKSKN